MLSVCLSRALLSYAFLCIPMHSAAQADNEEENEDPLCHHDQEIKTGCGKYLIIFTP